MFDIGFAELIIIGVVALIVIGPERLPEAVRTASAWLNRLRRSFNDIKQEVQQELHNDAVLRELRDSGKKLREEGESLKRQLNAPLDESFIGSPGKSSPGEPGAALSTDSATAADRTAAEPGAATTPEQSTEKQASTAAPPAANGDAEPRRD